MTYSYRLGALAFRCLREGSLATLRATPLSSRFRQPGLAYDGPPLAPASVLSRHTPPRPLIAQQMRHAGRVKRL